MSACFSATPEWYNNTKKKRKYAKSLRFQNLKKCKCFYYYKNDHHFLTMCSCKTCCCPPEHYILYQVCVFEIYWIKLQINGYIFIIMSITYQSNPLVPTNRNLGKEKLTKLKIISIISGITLWYYHNHHHCNACHNAREGTLGED